MREVAVTEAAEELITGVKRKTKERWMTEDIVELIVKRTQVKKSGKYETIHEEIQKKKCEEAKERWINDKCRKIELYRRSTEQTMYRNIEEISEKKTSPFTGCLK